MVRDHCQGNVVLLNVEMTTKQKGALLKRLLTTRIQRLFRLNGGILYSGRIISLQMFTIS